MRLLLACFSILFISQLSAQSDRINPVTWTISLDQQDDNNALVTFDAEIQDGWVIYGVDKVEDGPIPTSFALDESTDYTATEKLVINTEAKTKKCDLFGMVLDKFIGKASFAQAIKINNTAGKVTGYLTYMTCNGEQCLPPKDVEFELAIN